MTKTECRYAQVKKEALATTWTCEKFAIYVLGKKFTIETNHKPLVPLLGNKSLHSLPPRISCFQLRLAHFKYEIFHIPRKSLVIGNTLSHSQSNPQTMMSTAGKRELNILWKHVSTAYLLAASVWQNLVKLTWLTLSAQQSSITAKMTGLQNRTLCYRSRPNGKLEDSSQFMVICYCMGKE